MEDFYLKANRESILQIDEQMRALFVKRMECCKKIGEWKKKNNIPLVDKEREQLLLEKNSQEVPEELREYYCAFLKETIRQSRRLQSTLSVEKGHLYVDIPLGYDIFIGKGLLNKVDKIFDLNRKVAVITDSGVPKEYAEHVMKKCKEPTLIVLEQGEQSKNTDTLKMLWEKLLENHFSRHDCIVSVGGGMVSDIVGFCASTYMRGIDFYNIPTTLLAMVDASVGGKTAIDFDGVKNAVGSFYQPSGVLMDTDVLKTLDERQMACGMAEVIKVAFAFDKEFVYELEKGDLAIEDIIEKAVLIKKCVVECDEKEDSLRMLLNFGHTLGHGIEATDNFAKYSHGEAVALGMLPMTNQEVRSRLEKLLEKYHLPTKGEYDVEEVLSTSLHDKKAKDGFVFAIVCEEIGKAQVVKLTAEEWTGKIRNYHKESQL